MLNVKIKIKSFIPFIFAAAALSLLPQSSPAQVFLSVRIGPPPLPVYVQPPCPQPGYLWTPGYWAYGPMGYYWVPGVWVAPPRVGLLWTPGYWGFVNGLYVWRGGYWGPHVGFYGGVNYGFGYSGFGFVGGGWYGGVFRYNTAVMNVNTAVVRDVYVDRSVVRPGEFSRASFNGPGGVMARPTEQERAWEHEQHFQPTGHQLAHMQTAGQDRNQWASANHGRPGTMAMDAPNGRRFAPEPRMQEARGGGHAVQQEQHPRNSERSHANQNHHEERRP